MFKYLLMNRQYLRYWLASVCSDLGYYARNVLFLFLVYTINHSARAVSIMLVCEYAPNILAPLIGTLVDRWSRKWTFVCANLGRALSVVVVLLLLPFHAVWIAYVGAVVGSVAGIFAYSSSYAFIQEFVPREDRQKTSALRQMGYSAMMLVGPAIGTGLYEWLHLAGALSVGSAFFVASAILLATIHSKPVAASGGPRRVTFWTDLTEGLAYAVRKRTAQQLLVSAVANGIVGGVVNLLEIFVITEFLHLPKSMLAVLLAVQGIASLLTAPIFSRIKLPIERVIAVGVVIIGLGQWLMVSVPSFPVTLFGVLIEGIGISSFQMSSATLQQVKLAPAFQGRFTTVNNMVVTSVMSLTMLLTGWLHATLSVRILLILSGLCACIIGFILYVMGKRPELKMAEDAPDTASI